MVRRWLPVIGVVLGLAVPVALAAPAEAAGAAGPVLRVEGAVAAPASYSAADLAALATTTVQVRERFRTHTEQGIPLGDLVERSQPTLPAAKNALLRVTATVGSPGRQRVTFALGELDPNFGNHPAVLSVNEDGRALARPKLVVPGDVTALRFVDVVDRVTVGVANPAPTTPTAGGIDVLNGHRTVTLTAGLLGRLPARTVDVSFIAGTAAQRHIEHGPALALVLALAGTRLDLNTWVAAVGSDGYVAVVTPAEALVGGRTLLVSTSEDGVALAQPRLVTGGDVKGGRYVSLMVDLVAGEGPAT